jgi:glycylpeptide N-tetradecanoyltransferase|tara:strand:+ start:366 stop:656 length:291 start_codon:yes stop_codon:yes gene_type:complete
LQELYKLLVGHYVEDDDGEFRFDYSTTFLKWALNPPGHYPEWCVGIRDKEKNNLYAFISGIPVDLTIQGKTVKMAEINFLCAHKALRSMRLAPVLI